MSDDVIETPVHRTVEAWAKQKTTGSFEFAGTKQHEQWGEGRELTEAEFDAAVQRFAELVLY